MSVVNLEVIKKTQVGFEGEWRIWIDTTQDPEREFGLNAVQGLPVGAVATRISAIEYRIKWTPTYAPGGFNIFSFNNIDQFTDGFVLEVIENRFLFTAPDGFGGEVDCELQFELDLSITRGAITPERFASLFDVIDIQRTIGYVDQDIQSRVIVSPTMTLAIELLSTEQSDVANFYSYFRDGVKNVKFIRGILNGVLLFRGEQNIEQIEQRGEYSLLVEFDGISAGKLREPFKNGVGELNPTFNSRYANYEETFSNFTYYKIQNLFKAISEDFGFDGYSISQKNINNFVLWFSPNIQRVEVSEDFGGTNPVYTSKNALFGIPGLDYFGKFSVENLGDALKNFALWLDLVIEFDNENRCDVRSFWDSDLQNILDDDIIEIQSKINGVKKLEFVVATGIKNSYGDSKYYFSPKYPILDNSIPKPPTFYGEGFAPSAWDFYETKGLFLDESKNKAIPDSPFFVTTNQLDVVQIFGILVPFTVKFPIWIEVNTDNIEYLKNGVWDFEEQTFPSMMAASAWQYYKKNREKITVKLRGVNWKLSKNYLTSPTSRLGESLKLKPIEYRIFDGEGTTEATFINIT